MRDAQWSRQANHYVEVVSDTTGRCLARGDSMTMLRAAAGDTVRLNGRRLRVVWVERVIERSCVGAVLYVVALRARRYGQRRHRH